MRTLALAALLGALFASVLSSTNVQADPSFGLDPPSPTLGGPAGPADTLNPAPPGTPGFAPPALPPPVVAIPGVPGANIDAHGYGNDAVFSGVSPMVVAFSVDEASGGVLGGTGPADVFFNTATILDGAAGDTYLMSLPGGAPLPIPPGPPPCFGPTGNHILIDADGMDFPGPVAFPFPNTPGLGLVEPPGPPPAPVGTRDNLDAIDLSDPSLVAPVIPGPPVAGPIFFSLDPPSAAALGPPVPPFVTANSAADIFVTGGPWGLGLTRFADAASLGLVVGDDIDALAVDYFTGAFPSWLVGGGTDVIVFSLVPGSPSLGGLVSKAAGCGYGIFALPVSTGGDLFAQGAPVGAGPFVPAVPYLAAEELGLCTFRFYGPGVCLPASLPSDNVDALDITSTPLLGDLDGDMRVDGVDTDDDGDAVGDAIDNCPLVANPAQTNSDSGPMPPIGDVGAIGNGTGILGDDDTVPGGDAEGDVCDADDDNDGTPDGLDLDPGVPRDVTVDDDGDGMAAAGCFGGGDGADDGVSWDTDCNGTLDGAPAICGSAVMDADGDGLMDAWETCHWGTSNGSTDSDLDGSGDCTEAFDMNGNGFVTNGDATSVQQAFFNIIGRDWDFDVNGNGSITNGDATFVRQAFFGVNPCL
jgi:hypothetical protein